MFCRDKYVSVATKVCLPGQNICRKNKNKIVATNFCHDKIMFVATKDKNMFVAYIRYR